MKTFLLHWRGDKTEPAESIDIADAFRKPDTVRGASTPSTTSRK